MQSLASFLNMGGHAGFVWGAWGLAALVIGGLTWSSEDPKATSPCRDTRP